MSRYTKEYDEVIINRKYAEIFIRAAGWEQEPRSPRFPHMLSQYWGNQKYSNKTLAEAVELELIKHS